MSWIIEFDLIQSPSSFSKSVSQLKSLKNICTFFSKNWSATEKRHVSKVLDKKAYFCIFALVEYISICFDTLKTQQEAPFFTQIKFNFCYHFYVMHICIFKSLSLLPSRGVGPGGRQTEKPAGMSLPPVCLYRYNSIMLRV